MSNAVAQQPTRRVGGRYDEGPHAALRVALLTNQIPPYRLPLLTELAHTPNWEFHVFTCVEREVDRLWEVEKAYPFRHKRSVSVSFVARRRRTSVAQFVQPTQVHLPVGEFADLFRFRPDVVISSEFGMRSLIAAAYARLFGSRLLLYYEGTPHTDRDCSWGQRLLRRVLRRLPSMYVCNGRQSRRYVERLGVAPEKVFECGQALDVDAFAAQQSDEDRDALRRRLGISGLCYLYTGRLIPLKGIHHLLDSWARFSREDGVQATLVLVGEGELKESLEKQAAAACLTNVIFHPFVQPPQLPAFYHAADVYVLPSLEDCWSLAVEEAMASGLPVIDSKYNGGSELILEGENGWVADPLDHDDLSAKLRLAWEARGRKAAMGQRARETVARMSIANVVGRFRAAVAQSVSGGGSMNGKELWRNGAAEIGRLTNVATHAADCTENGPSLVPEEAGHGGKPHRTLARVGRDNTLTTAAARQSLKNLGLRALGAAAVGLNGLLGNRAGGAVGILTYHRVAPPYGGVPSSDDCVASARFRQQLLGLIRRGYTFWPLRRILEHHERGERVPPRTLAVTFDDGSYCVHAHAWPVLRELKVPATVFLATAYLDGEEPFPFDRWGMTWRDVLPPEAYRPLTTEQCREMMDSGLVELGAHTHSHGDFRGRPDALAADMRVCLDVLRQRFGLVGSPSFAFPFGKPHLGYASEASVAVVKAAGVRCALTTRSVLARPGSDCFDWGRFNVFPWDTDTTLSAKVAGWYSWAVVLRSRLLKLSGSHGRPPVHAVLREETP